MTQVQTDSGSHDKWLHKPGVHFQVRLQLIPIGDNISERKSGTKRTKKLESTQFYDERTVTSEHDEMHTKAPSSIELSPPECATGFPPPELR